MHELVKFSFSCEWIHLNMNEYIMCTNEFIPICRFKCIHSNESVMGGMKVFGWELTPIKLILGAFPVNVWKCSCDSDESNHSTFEIRTLSRLILYYTY